MQGNTLHPASYKDPSGFIFLSDGKVYRQVNKIYAEHYEFLMNSGLYEELTKNRYLLPHKEIKENTLASSDWFKTLLPEQITLITYPYEWCFEQLKDAALLTLKIVKSSVEKGMILKDATPFNIQFYKGRPVLIDTLSFEKYDSTQPWIAYRQFCETFLFPLWLSHYHKTNFQNILSIYPDGIPIALTAKLLPAKSRMSLGVWLHVYLQNKISRRNTYEKRVSNFSQKKMLNLITHLEDCITKLNNTETTSWNKYYSENISSAEYLSEKQKIVFELMAQMQGNKVLDIGANEGYFSCIASERGYDVIATDNDEQCINKLYKKIKESNLKTILPLCIDITNPPPSSGFANRERTSWSKRIKPDIIFALALIHHLIISKNIPLHILAEYLSQLASQLIIEYVPKEDEKVQLLLRHKKNIFPDYTKEMFESSFQQYFVLIGMQQIPGTRRLVYAMKRKNHHDSIDQ